MTCGVGYYQSKMLTHIKQAKENTKIPFPPPPYRLCLGVHTGIEWNDHKGMELNVFKQVK